MKITEEKYLHDYLPDLIHQVLSDGKIDKLALERIIKRSSLIDGQPSLFFDSKKIKELCEVIDFRITAAALNCGLYFKAPRELALISGAGIAGLAASFELLRKGFNVVIAEKRENFSRSNVINLNVEVQRFLETFGLLKEFEESVAARIHTHKCVHVSKLGPTNLPASDVSQLRLGDEPFEPENFDMLFNRDGIYSVKIQDLQNFLAKKALDAGAHILGKVEVDVLARTKAGGVSKVQIMGEKSLCAPMILKPHLFFVAEGAHSTTAERLGMVTNVVKNECTGENWIFGNVEYPVEYSGKETFVVSIIDTSEEKLKIANVIFNAKIGQINIAVISKKLLSPELIKERILTTVKQAFDLEGIKTIPQSLCAVVEQPIHVENEKRDLFSKDNIFLIGDAAGRSSPLAGLGGTMGLTLVPRTIKQLLNDREQQPDNMHNNFKIFSESYTSRWIKKSEAVKKFCLGLFKKEQILSKESTLALKEGGQDEN